MENNAGIGLEKGVVRLELYSHEWKRIYEAEKAALLGKLAGSVLDIQHVGSTSIVGMIAKPIIDIAIAIADFEEARQCIPMIEAQGYEYRGEYGIPRRHYFVKGDPRTFHIHMMEIESPNWQDLLLFRDYLCHHPVEAHEYAELKAGLAAKYPQDREAYLEGKEGFIGGVIRKAREALYG